MAVTLHSVQDSDKTAVVTATGADATYLNELPHPDDPGDDAGKSVAWSYAYGSGKYLISSKAAVALGVATIENGLGSAAAPATTLPYFSPGHDAWVIDYNASSAARKVALDALPQYGTPTARVGRQTQCWYFKEGAIWYVSVKAYNSLPA